jgi:hypothetical protein
MPPVMRETLNPSQQRQRVAKTTNTPDRISGSRLKMLAMIAGTRNENDNNTFVHRSGALGRGHHNTRVHLMTPRSRISIDSARLTAPDSSIVH